MDVASPRKILGQRLGQRSGAIRNTDEDRRFEKRGNPRPLRSRPDPYPSGSDRGVARQLRPRRRRNPQKPALQVAVALRTAEAIDLAADSMASLGSPSTITRSTGSVPEGRSSTLPLPSSD